MWLSRVILTAILAFVALIADQSGFLRHFDDRLVEARMRLAPREATNGILLVDIDAKSIAAIGRWPWPRRTYAQTIDRLREMQASLIALDIDLSSASTEPEDAALEAALQRAADTVVLVAFSRRATASPMDADIAESEPLERFERYAWLANVNVTQDSDGFVRQFSFAEVIGGEVVPTLPTLFSGAAGSVGDSYLIDFSIRANTIDRISLVDLIRGDVHADRIRGKNVIVGAEATELRDFFNVPVAGVVSGPMLQALATETLAQHRALSVQPPIVSISGLLLVFLLAVWLISRLSLLAAMVTIALAAVTIEGAALAIQTNANLVPQTVGWHGMLIAVGLVIVFKEIDLQKILVSMWRRRTSNMETILKTVVRDNFAGVLVIDERGQILSASDAACTILQLPEDPLGRQVEVVKSDDLREALQRAIEALRSGTWHEQASKEVTIEVDGQARILEYVVTPSRLSSGNIERGEEPGHAYIACLTFSDITDRRRDQDRIAYLARFDTLTGLTNRNRFIELAAAAINGSSESCAIVCFDLDRFQVVNDTLGHGVGDQLIRAMGKRAQQLAAADNVLARLGSDELAVLFCAAHAKERAEAFITALLEQAGIPFPIEGHPLIVGISGGIAIARPEGDTAADLLMRADTALNRAKIAGGNTFKQFDASMMEGVAERQVLEADLWHALDVGGFELAYQPQFDLGTMQLTGVEALLRWRHPTRGYIPPGEFVPLAEAIGLIGRIGEWVLEEACHTVTRWPVAIKVAVNVSPLQFARGDLVAAVARCLDSSGLAPSQLDLEITESLFFEKSSAVNDALQRLRDIGVGLVLDDFGTGYSSLGYLHTYQVDKIKIDRSFVVGIPGDDRSVAIIQSVTGLAANLGIRVNAEGLEREEQVALLRLMGCQEGQGFFLGCPQSAQQIESLMRESSTARIVA